MSIDKEKYIKECFEREDIITQEKNKVYVLGTLLGVEEEGIFNGREHYIVLMKTEREKNKPLLVWVVFRKEQKTKDLILRGNKVFIEGYMATTYTFNSKAVTHTFIVPEKVYEIDKDIEIEKKRDFYLNYTVNNRVILEGRINIEPWREYIPPADNYVTRFSIDYEVKGKKRSMYCTVWDTVNDIEELKKGQRIRIVGSFNLLKKERGLKIENGVVVESRKNKLDSYVIVAQRIEILEDVEEKKEQEENKNEN